MIELLVVIAIIAILAALIMPITGAVNRIKIRNRTKGELAEIVSAIQNYHSKRGFYPPDNPNNAQYINQLYYELSGTTLKDTTYTTLDGNSSLAISDLTPAFGANVTGFMNVTKPGSGDEGITAQKFLNEIKPAQLGDYNKAKILVASVGWPANQPGAPITGTTLNPWRYVSTNPTNNPKSFDLWVDVFDGHKTNRICNWTTQVLTP